MTELEILKSVIFYGFAAVLILFAVLSIFSYRIIWSLLFAVGVFFSTSGIFFILGAEYNAVVQIAIYGIAIPILFVFGIMFTADKMDKSTYLTVKPRLLFSFFSVGLLFMALIYLIATSLSLTSNSKWILTKQTMSINMYQMFKALTDGIFVNYVYAFELLSVLLLVVVVGISTLSLFREKTDD